MIKKSKLFQAVYPCVRIFRFFCFADISVSRRSSVGQKFAAFWIVIKYLVMIGILGYQLTDSILGQINSLQDSSRIPVHRIIYVLTATEGFVSIIHTLANSSKSLRFMKRMEEVDEFFLNALSVKIDYEDLRWTLLIDMLSFMVYLIGSIVVIAMATHQHHNLMRIALYFHVPILLMRIYVQRFTFMVSLLIFYLKESIKVLEKLINNQPVLVRREDIHTWRWNTKKNHLTIKLMQKSYRMLWQASCLINESFGVGLVYIFLVQLAFFLYLGYAFCIDMTKNDATHRQLISILLTLYGIFMIHYYCQQCLNNVIY